MSRWPAITATDGEPSVSVSEVFPSIQGEGPLCGQRAAFVRFAHCNLDCGRGEGATWECDTDYSWDWTNHDAKEQVRRIPVCDVAAWARGQGVDLLIVTGGEPMLQQDKLIMFARHVAPLRIQVETNGTIAPHAELPALIELFVVSPKLSNSGVAYHRRIKPPALRALADHGAVFKFVAVDASDLDEIAALVGEHDLDPVWVMPAGRDAETVLRRQRELADAVIKRGWNLSSRLHTLLWEDARGR